MLSLRLFAGLALDNPERTAIGRAGQRRRLALLAVIASPAGAAVAREKLLALLWPETPPDDARHRLSVALYDLRLALGEAAVTFNADTVTLQPAAIAIDTADFEAAVARQDWESAVALYTGPFLDGVYLVDAPEFEQWVDERRAALQRSYTRALEAVASERAQRGYHERAVDAWRILTRIDPYSERFAGGLMRALDATGNRSEALRHAAEHAERMRADLDADPAADIEHLAAELKRVAPTARTAQRVVQTSNLPHEVEALPTSQTPTSARTTRSRRIVSTAVLIVGSIALTAALRLLPSGALRMAPADASATAGNKEPALRALQTGDKHLRSGRFVEAGTAFERALHEDSTLAVARLQLAVATLWADQPGSDAEVVLARALEHRVELEDIDRILLDGFAAWKHGEWHRAEGLYRRALTIDPTAIEARHHLGEALFHYNSAQGRPTAEAKAEFEQVIALQPHHYSALWHLAQFAARDRRSDDVAKLTNRLDALQPDAIRRLEIDALRLSATRDAAGFNRLLERLTDADESLLFGIGWRLMIYGRDLAGAERVFTLLTAARRMPYARGLGHTQLMYIDAARGRNAVAHGHLKALAALRDPGVPVVWPALLLAIAPGKLAEVEQLRVLCDSLAQLYAHQRNAVTVREVEDLSALGVAFATLGNVARAREVAGELETRAAVVKADAPRLKEYTMARAALIRAVAAHTLGDPQDVIRWVDQSITYRWFGEALVHPDRSYGLQRYLRAAALRALGRTREADAWFAAIGEHDPSDLLFLPSALLQRAELAAAHGDSKTATDLRRQAAELSK